MGPLGSRRIETHTWKKSLTNWDPGSCLSELHWEGVWPPPFYRCWVIPGLRHVCCFALVCHWFLLSSWTLTAEPQSIVPLLLQSVAFCMTSDFSRTPAAGAHRMLL